MKAYIDFDIVIKPKEKDGSWEELQEFFQQIHKDFCIWSRITPDSITIIPQKINLDEPDMARFLETLEDIRFADWMEHNIESVVYYPETERITLRIFTKKE